MMMVMIRMSMMMMGMMMMMMIVTADLRATGHLSAAADWHRAGFSALAQQQ